MKAIEYFEKYGADIYAEFLTPQSLDKIGPTLQKLLTDFSAETTEILEKRHGKRPGALKAVVLDQNEKWNALCRIFMKKYGESPIKEDGWKNLVEVQNAQIISAIRRGYASCRID